VLLIQVRAVGDAMIAHERRCVVGRLGERAFKLHSRNVFEHIPEPAWLDDADALIIGGSGAFSVHDPRSRSWVGGLRKLMDRALSDQLPSFGICFGHQLLGLHLGGRVVTGEESAERGTIEIHPTDAAQQDPVFGYLPVPYRAHTGHSDSVPEIPKAVELLATTEACQAQAFRVRGAPFWSVQYHPDLLGADARSRYLAFAQNLGPEPAALAEAHADLFDPRADDTAGLLGSFLDHAISRSG